MNVLTRTALCTTVLFALASSVQAQLYIDVDATIDYYTYKSVIVGDHTSPTVNFVTGADVWALYSFSQSTINYSGGRSRHLDTYGTSTVNFTGGVLVGGGGGSLYAHDHSLVNFSGGGAQLTIASYDNAVVNMSGGGSPNLVAYGNSIFNVSGGLSGTRPEDGIYVNDNATFNFYGVGLNATLIRSNTLYNEYALSGLLLDGNDLAARHLYVQHDTGARFTLHNAAVPAPSSVLVLLLGALPGIALLRRRRE